MKWTSRKLGDVITLQRGHDLPEAQRRDGSIPIISSSGHTGMHDTAKAKGPGVVTGRYGTLGEVYFVDEDYWPLNTALYVVDFKGNNPRFISYFLKQALTSLQSDKAAVPGVNRNVVHALDVRVPDRGTQKRIAAILSAYDDLIENNRRRIAVLEDAAGQLYQEWFVRLRFPGREHTRLVDGIPEGWSRVALGRLTNKIGSGATPRGGESAYVAEGIPLIRSLNVYDDRFVEDGLVFLTEDQAASLDSVTVEQADILLNITGASVARCCMAPGRYLPARVNQHVMIIRVDRGEADPFFVHAAINSDERKRQLLSYAQKGSTREALTKAMMSAFEITMPPPPLVHSFGDFAKAAFEQRENLSTQNEKLRTVRDLLLPRLMSGAVKA